MSITDDQLSALRWAFARPTIDTQFRLTVLPERAGETSTENDSGLDDKDLDRRLRVLVREGLLEGEPAKGDGTYHWWMSLRVRSGGLRLLHEWPPDDVPPWPGPWRDDRTWGRRDRRVLEYAIDTGFPADLYLRPDDSPCDQITSLTKHDLHFSIVTLREAGLLSGDDADLHLWSDLEATNAGRELMAQLDLLVELPAADTNGNGLERAETLLASGYCAEAANTAGKVLETRLKQHARVHSVPLMTSGGQPRKAQQIAQDLGVVLGKTRSKAVTAWLGLRNDGSHAPEASQAAQEPNAKQVRLMIDGIRLFIAEVPVG